MAVSIDPIHQFELQPLVSLGHIGNQQLAFTQSALYMFAAVGIIALLTIVATSGRSVVPGRLQALAETLYEFIADTVHQATGEDGKRFLPLVFSLFMFVLILNLLGMIPYAFAVTSHLIVTFGLALVVILTVVIYGVAKHGTHFLGVFVPSGVPKPLLLIMVPIEIVSFLSRPISLSVRLFANILAGHIALKIFAFFVVQLLVAGAWGVLSPLPLALTIALTALEFLVAALQAYVFATLTAVYLADALHPGH
ncbi:MAG: F0F1 ATP synthase subunit A [Methylobacteriaceae bacterium]|jgi:F-type H+-transporting ATPase subunit a|uniref:ATP synthase subunit a n=5 Tax=Methylorubrum extorquens TaxID=408 RepID=C5AXQ7_METEA|nr:MULTISPECIES: F0F1 ATP synthase subunit A [Methylobacteriaceae]KQO92874.1 ATP synthase F0F1 subunit A [Methylobacterium sp. Leaf90]KQO96253.1 ATP synthase F0F1 subunit A [Methylobacterium sp. Leaf92]KQP86854.1 ATP synthase F0F1 subunit A [Methylobacterium sp. Leaf119]KQQ15345.1 ATP synthase F0F1 subunit A [Methylobacterium sp. Leaf121]MBA9067913.1 F-type H+-transporting ATPase subunit a [Methylobacterium sp. RAS18]MCJ2028417.1 F0F1 ATP synthase subunit A [Methylobacterium sp. J-043]MDF986